MVIDYSTHVKSLMKANPQIKAASVFTADGQVLYITPNWDINKEVKKVLQAWVTRAPFITVNGKKYSMLQCTPERLITTSVHKDGHVVGAITPDGNYLLTLTKSDGNYQVSYMDTARVADQMRVGGKELKLSSAECNKLPISLGDTKKRVEISSRSEKEKHHYEKKSTGSIEGPIIVTQARSDDSALGLYGALTHQRNTLKGSSGTDVLTREILNFQSWIKNPAGLPAFISQAMAANDPVKIARLASIYRKLYDILVPH